MNKTFEDIEKFYFSHFDDLSTAKKLHWLSRHYLWFNDNYSFELLQKYRSHYFGKNTKETARLYSQLYKENYQSPKNKKLSLAKRIREELLDREYPYLNGMNVSIFRCLIAQTVFRIDIRNQLAAVITRDEIMAVRRKMINHPRHIGKIATKAVNFLYLSEWVYDIKRINPEFYLKIAEQSFPLKKSDEAMILLYMLTHCIIGETRFYSRKIKYNRDVYQRMLMNIDKLINRFYKKLSLDIKVESLLCSRLIGCSMGVNKKIIHEAKKSQKDYLVDRYNSFRYHKNKSISMSEHRNILYVMAVSNVPQRLKPVKK